MYFLSFWSDIGSWISDAVGNVIGTLEIAIRWLSFSLSTMLYKLIIHFYDMFELLCKGRLLDSDLLKELSTRIGYILGLVMLFNIIFSMIKMLLEPDKMNDKDFGAGALIKKVIIVIVMLGVSNFVFNLLYTVQKTVVESQVISNLLLPYKISDDELEENFGRVLAEELMYAFYHEKDLDGITLDVENEAKYDICLGRINDFRNQIIKKGEFSLGRSCLNESIKIEQAKLEGGTEIVEEFIVDYDLFLSPIVGGITAYFLFMYCFSVGVRMIQLMVLEIISPMAFVSYLSPKKETMFSKWTKLYISTYIDVFIRIVIINFVIFLVATILGGVGGEGDLIIWDSLGGKDSLTSDSRTFITVVLVFALLTFAKKAPELLKNLFPSTGGSGLSFGASMKNVVGLNKTLGMAAGLGTGAAIGLIGKGVNGLRAGKGWGKLSGALGGMVTGAVGGAFRGAASGYKAKNAFGALGAGAKSQAKSNLAYAQRKASGISLWEKLEDKVNEGLGIQTGFAGVDKRISENQAVIDAVSNSKSVKAFNDQVENVKENIAIKRNETQLKFYSDMLTNGIEKDTADLFVEFVRKTRYKNSKEFSNLSEDEKLKYDNDYYLLVKKIEGLKNIDKNYANSLAGELINQNDIYDSAIKQANKKADNMADAVYFLADGNITELEKIEGISKEVKKDGKIKYYIEGTEVTDWGSISATVKSYKSRYGKNHQTLGDFKGENGELRETAARQSHRKTSK